jgi:hypothetical protein
LHQPADVVQRPRVGEDQHDDDTRTPAARALPARGCQRGSTTRRTPRQWQQPHRAQPSRAMLSPSLAMVPAVVQALKLGTDHRTNATRHTHAWPGDHVTPERPVLRVSTDGRRDSRCRAGGSRAVAAASGYDAAR